MPQWSAKANRDMTRLTTEDNETQAAVDRLHELIDEWANQNPSGMHVKGFSGNGLKYGVSVTIKDGEVLTVEHR
jgi:hypothetical protein